MAASGQGPDLDALTEGYTRGFAVGAGFLLIAAPVAFFMFKVGKEAVREDDLDG